MAITKKKNRRPTIDLTGPAGNAYVLLGYASKYAEELKIDPGPILEQMKSGDYENLIEVFDSHFGDYVDLER